ncbi:Glycosyltransferase involved in cell wall bisynthesis [Tessaracoccus bendigoensis DSM 12906]|uniref:Glycosyltransferase involved in cell wall bisynthesis n=1 Tax=Tessaracoccus bendigoensis DSM 12906 TaxID=1123357 RepID=A0A1M6DI64_9ACTN|nr:glycosyltransferase [Tessaracoccus bendigoensis]SHI72946.1 Glycosyltransferase involved in cell wall bisynthesis [Tessaracoccus bendigoensis DSM 12906]
MNILMLVATSVATDTRVLREARTLVQAGHSVHIVGRSVPDGFDPGDGLTVSSVGTSSVFRAEGGSSLQGRKMSPVTRLARWALLPQHRHSAFGRWADGAIEDGRGRQFDVVHAHDFTALRAAATLAGERNVPFVYDSHEFWPGLPREYRPTPLADRRERREEAEFGGRAAAVLTVGEGVADALRNLYGWDNVTVVHNSFPLRDDLPEPLPRPRGLVYAGRVAAFRELETIAEASRGFDLPITVIGPADETWLTTFDRARLDVQPARPLEEASQLLQEAGVSLVTHSNKWLNHRLAMPNKLFHAVSLGVPLVATDVGELARMVRRYDLGALYTPGDAESLRCAIGTVVRDYPRWAGNVRAARSELSWESDADRLVAVYADLDRTREERTS